jgi:DNA-directed RNA polymerase specialized sigma24 family protein
MDFKRRPTHELDRLSDEELIAYVVAAREAGDGQAIKDGLGVLAHRRIPDLKRRAAIKVPFQDAEDLAMQALGEAVLARFEGSSVGEFMSLVHTILSRRIADHYEKRERTLDTVPLPEEHSGDEEIHHREAAITPDPSGAVGLSDLVERILDGRSDEHQRVIELYVLEDLSAEDTAAQVNEQYPAANPKMSVANVHQIASRFREELRQGLEATGP